MIVIIALINPVCVGPSGALISIFRGGGGMKGEEDENRFKKGREEEEGS